MIQPKLTVLAGEENLLLNAYLLEMEERIGDIAPIEESDSFLDEVRVHLHQAIRRRVERGETRLHATRAALDKFGPARTNADDFLASWYENELRTPLGKRFGRANLAAYGAFQIAEVVCVLILQLNVFLPNEASYRIPFSPAQVRSVWPEPLPFPDLSLRFLTLMATPILLPIVAGWLVGRWVPVRAAAACYHGMIPLILCSFVLGALMLPTTETLLFALFQIAFWLPVGCLTAHVSSNLSRGGNRRERAQFRVVEQRPEAPSETPC
ncbi:MAG: hypothetical protein ACO1SV_27420 [Fimbriimonas sp.]